MVRKIDKFQESMKPSEELYTKELERYANQYPALGEIILKNVRILMPWIIYTLLSE